MKHVPAEELVKKSLASTTSLDYANAAITNILSDATYAAARGEWSVEGRTREHNQRHYIKNQLEELGYRVRICSWDFGKYGGCMWPERVGYVIKVSWGPRWWERK